MRFASRLHPLLALLTLRLPVLAVGEKPADVLSHRVLFEQPEFYAAWPALVRAANGDILLTFIRTEQHLSPNGAVVALRSTDNARTWQPPVVSYDSPLDDRECGLTVAPGGQLLLHVWSQFWQPSQYTALQPDSYPADMIARWIAHVETPAYKAAAPLHGAWVLASSDHGHTWSKPASGPDTIHGGITLRDGSLMAVSYRDDVPNVTVHTAASPTGPWKAGHVIRPPDPTKLQFGEPHLAQLPGGRIIVMLRAIAVPYDDLSKNVVLWETYSDDNGRTWAPLFPTPLWGYPPHLTVLHDGRVLVTYGYRRPPFGQRAALSVDGITWEADKVIVLRDDAPNPDLGYPASLELSPGTILSVYYQQSSLDPADRHRPKPAIMATLWRVPTTK